MIAAVLLYIRRRRWLAIAATVGVLLSLACVIAPTVLPDQKYDSFAGDRTLSQDAFYARWGPKPAGWTILHSRGRVVVGYAIGREPSANERVMMACRFGDAWDFPRWHIGNVNWDTGVVVMTDYHDSYRGYTGRRYWDFTLHGFMLPLWLPAVLLLVPAAFFTLGLVLAVLRARPAGHCLQCGYNLTGNTSGICPECGTRCGTAPENAQVRRWPWLRTLPMFIRPKADVCRHQPPAAR